MSEEQPIDFEALDRKTKREYARLRKELRPDLDTVLSNQDGLARLLAISDEQWKAAVDAEADSAP